MKKIVFISLLLSSVVYSQSISELKKRFDSYLNFNGSLNSVVKFDDKSIKILNLNKSEFTIYDGEQLVLNNFFKTQTTTDLIVFYTWKKNNALSKKQLDSLYALCTSKAEIPIIAAKEKPLFGKRIAIDPGHFAGNVTDAKVEQKFIEFIPDSASTLKDTIRFNEGRLTFLTAELLKQQLEQQGATVFVTRTQQNYTAFNNTYQNWFDTKRKKVLDSLLLIQNIDKKKHLTLIKQTKEKLFWSFFRDYELAERTRLINAFKPDATVIIHYNVDEKNTDWKKPTTKNYTMAFIAGAMTADNFNKTISKIHFVRLLLSNQLNQSEQLSMLSVQAFNKQLQIPIATKTDADYLKNSCLSTSSKGVFCRNLALCRTINSPLVYGETLYQDNINECQKLNANDFEINGLKLPKRIYEVAQCYYSALNSYFNR